MTFLEIVNEVLKRLREDTVASVTESTYSTMVGDFVKQSYIEMSNAYQWPQLDETQDIGVVVNDTSFTITSGDSGEGVHDIHSIYNVTDKTFLKASNYKEVRNRLSDDLNGNQPFRYAYGGETADGTTTIHFHPKSDGSYTLRVNYNRKPNLKNTLVDATYIKLPDMPIILRAYALSIAERGEDGGAMSNKVDFQANTALSDAISLYESNNNYDNTSWFVI